MKPKAFPLQPDLVRFVSKVFLLAGILGLALPALAGNRTWTGAINGYWSEPGNWSPSGAPQSGDDLSFNSNASKRSMTNDLTNLTISSLGFDNADASYYLSGNAMTLTNIFCEPSGGSAQVTVACALYFAGSASVIANPANGIVTSDLMQINLDGPIVVNGQLALFAYASDGAAGGSGRIYIQGAVSGPGSVLAEADEYGGMEGYVQFEGTANGALSGDFQLKTIGTAKISFNQTPGATVNPTVSVLNGDTANLEVLQANQSGTTLVINSGSQLHLSGGNATFAGLVMRNFSGDTQPSVLDTGSILAGVNSGGIAIRCDNNNVTPTLKGRLNLNGDPTLDVHGTASVGLEIDANISGGGFNKVGGSTLILNGVNTFTGTAQVSAGILDVRTSSALGATGGSTTLAGGSLTLHTSISGETLIATGQSVAGDMPGSLLNGFGLGSITWGGPVVLNTNLVVIGTSDFNFTGAISGPGGLFASSGGTVQIGGTDANTFSGTLLARCPLLELNKPSGAKAYSGPLVAGGGAGGPYEVRWLQPYQNVYATLTLYSNAIVNLNNHNEDFGPVTFNGGTVETGSGQFAIYQPLTVNPNAATAVISGNLGLPPNDARTFNVADGPADPDLLVNAVVFGSPTYFVKQGAGTMELANANTFLATTLHEGGTLAVANASGLGNSGSGCVIFDGATLRFDVNATLPNNFEAVGNGVGGTSGAFQVTGSSSVSLNGSILLDASTLFNVASTAALALNGPINGTGPLVKTGGLLTFGGSSANTYSGDTVIQSGEAILGKSGGAISVPGNLVLGPAGSAGASALLTTPNSIGGDTVTINANSSLNLNGRVQTLSHVNLNDGGSLTTGAGTLHLNGGATVNAGSRNLLGSSAGATISGNIGLPPNALPITFSVGTFNPMAPSSAPELDVPATISITSSENPNLTPTRINKNGAGRMRLGANDTYQSTIVNAGTLQVDGTLSGGVTVSGGTLAGAGTVGPIAMISSSSVVSPGNGPGILTCGNFNNGGGSGIFKVALNGTTAGTGYSQLNVNGTVDLNNLTLSATLGYASSTNDQFTIIANNTTAAITGTFNGLPDGAQFYIGGQLFQINYREVFKHIFFLNNVVLTRLPTPYVPPVPMLTIERQPPDSVRLLWATNDPALNLQWETNLSANNWSTAALSPVVIGTNNVVTDTGAVGSKFYRLVRP